MDHRRRWMDLNELRKKRDELGGIDPLWVIPTTDRQGGKWNPEEFLASGGNEIAATEILNSGGARALDIREDGFAGPEWIGYQYFATKS